MIGQWFYLLFGLLFFTANGHLALISLLVDSYRALLSALRCRTRTRSSASPRLSC